MSGFFINKLMLNDGLAWASLDIENSGWTGLERIARKNLLVYGAMIKSCSKVVDSRICHIPTFCMHRNEVSEAFNTQGGL